MSIHPLKRDCETISPKSSLVNPWVYGLLYRTMGDSQAAASLKTRPGDAWWKLHSWSFLPNMQTAQLIWESALPNNCFPLRYSHRGGALWNLQLSELPESPKFCESSGPRLSLQEGSFQFEGNHCMVALTCAHVRGDTSTQSLFSVPAHPPTCGKQLQMLLLSLRATVSVLNWIPWPQWSHARTIPRSSSSPPLLWAPTPPSSSGHLVPRPESSTQWLPQHVCL